MANAKKSRLKVFEAQFGFYDSVVAVPSQAAALRAWGAHQNLFADGHAWPATEAAAVKAALAHPGAPLRRAIGSGEAYSLDPTGLPEIPAADARTAPKKPAGGRKAKAPHRPPPDRSALDAAERALADLDEARKREEARLERRQQALDAEIATAQQAYVERHEAAAAAVARARKAWREAGGRG